MTITRRIRCSQVVGWSLNSSLQQLADDGYWMYGSVSVIANALAEVMEGRFTGKVLERNHIEEPPPVG
jgi:hypothetical protein